MGDNAQLVAVMAAAMLLDVATGIAKGVKAGGVESSKMREGLWHKAGYVGVVALAFLVARAGHLPGVGVDAPAVGPVCAFIVLTEVVSVFENVCELNPDLRGSGLFRLFGGKGGSDE